MKSAFVAASSCVTPLGFSTSENYSALFKGHTAIHQQHLPFSEQAFTCAYIPDQSWQEQVKKNLRLATLTKLESLCCLAIQDVLKLTGRDLSAQDSLLILASTKGNIDILDGASHIKDPTRAYLPAFAQQIANYFKAHHTPLIVSNACISGLLALIIAQRFLKAGKYKHILVCGADLVSEFTVSGFRSFNALSEEPCRPFDKERKGINLGEGAAAILLTSDKTDIELVSGASANDANHISGPARDGQGLFQAIQQATQGIDRKSIDFINAHGTATEYNDEMEAIAFSRADLSSTAVHSLKGYYGHTLGAAGVLESIIAIECLRNNTLIKSQGFQEVGTSIAQRMITNTESKLLTTCLKTASGFGGCNAAAIFRKIA